jgi:hypothetical protein
LIRSLHAGPKPHQVIRQFRGNDPAALFVHFAPVEGNPESAAAGPAGQAGVVGRGKAFHRCNLS